MHHQSRQFLLIVCSLSRPLPPHTLSLFQARIYDYLFRSEDPGSAEAWLEDMNSDSLESVTSMYITPALAQAKAGDRFQFERLGYYAVDKDSVPGRLVFNRTVTLKESAAAKVVGKQ